MLKNILLKPYFNLKIQKITRSVVFKIKDDILRAILVLIHLQPIVAMIINIKTE